MDSSLKLNKISLSLNNNWTYENKVFFYDASNHVDIPVFLRAMNSLEVGDCYRLCRQLCKVVDDKWTTTYLRNTNDNWRKLVRCVSKYGGQIKCDTKSKVKFSAGCSQHRGQAQMFDLFSLPSQLSNTLSNINNTIPNFNLAAESLKSTSDSVGSIVNSFQMFYAHLIEQVKSGMDSLGRMAKDIITYVIKFIALGYLLLEPNNQTIPNITALLTLILPPYILGGIQDLALGLIRAIQGMNKAEAQTDEDCNKGLVMAFVTLTKDIISTMVGSADAAVLSGMTVNAKKVKIVVDYIKGATTIVEFITKLWFKVLEILGDSLMKHFGILPSFMKEDQLSQYIDEFLAIKENRDDISCSINMASASRVLSLYDKIFKLEAKIAKQQRVHGPNFRMNLYLRIMVKALETMCARIPDHFRTGLAPRRVKPFWVYIYGDPRIGKSAVFQPYIVSALAKTMGLIDKYEDYTNYTYLRNCGEKYWEGYDKHPVLWYNDLFQNCSDEEAMNLGIMELTNIVDDNIFPLEMAFERKHNVYFNSRCVISNAQNEIINMPFITNRCWSGGAHLYARRDVCVKMTLNPAYKKDDVGIDQYKMQQYMREHPANCVGYENCVTKTQVEFDEKLLFPNDLYDIYFTDPMSGDVLFKCNFPDAIKYICDKAREYESKQGSFKDRLYNHFEQMWAQSDEDQYFDCLETRVDDAFRETLSALQTELGYIGGELSCLRESQICNSVYRRIYRLNNFARANNRPVQATLCIQMLDAQALVNLPPSFWQTFCYNARNNIQTYRDYFMQFLSKHQSTISQVLVGLLSAVALQKLFNWYINMQPTKPRNRVERAQTHEGTNKVHKSQVIRKRVAQAYTDINRDVELKIARQLCTFRVEIYDDQTLIDSKYFGSGLCVGADVFIIPNHFLHRWRQMYAHYCSHGCEFRLILQWNDQLSANLDFRSLLIYRVDRDYAEDLVFLRIPGFVNKKKLAHLFLKSGDDPTPYGSYLYGYRKNAQHIHIINVDNVQMTSVSYVLGERTEERYGGKFAGQDIVVPQMFQYDNCNTVAGDCGLLLINSDSSLSCRKIMGMHTAGSPSANWGAASIIYQEDVQEALEAFYEKDTPIYPIEEEMVEAQGGLSDELRKIGLQVVGKLPKLVVPEYNINKNVQITLPRKTKITKSLVHDIMATDYGESYSQPARLRPFEKDGVTYSPLMIALTKMVKQNPFIRTAELETISQHVSDTIISYSSPFAPRVFNDHEAVNGFGKINALEMTTSGGYPYTHIDNTKGKLPFFNIVQENPLVLAMGSYLKARVLERESLAKQGLIMPTYFIDTLKDETRPREKVAQGKTRLFQIGPMDLNILIRKYFGQIMNHLRHNYLTCEMAVGINANSYEWTYMVRNQMAGIDPQHYQCLNGDLKNCDASGSQQIGYYICKSINTWYQQDASWKKEDDVVRMVLFKTFLNSKHIVSDIVYEMNQGNKSGTAITTDFNNFLNMFLIRYAYIQLGYDLRTFNKNVRPKFYGDDDNTGINTMACPRINPDVYSKILYGIGFEYTSAIKDKLQSVLYTIDQTSFLKRKFTFDGEKYLPQLDKNVIMDIPRWSESDPDNMVDQMNRFNSALLEMSNYGYEEFQSLRKSFVNYCCLLVKMGYNITASDLFTFSRCESIKWENSEFDNKLLGDRCAESGNLAQARLRGRVSDVQLPKLPGFDGRIPSSLIAAGNAQTHEGSGKPHKPQVVRKLIAQSGEDLNDGEDEFDLFLVIQEKLKEMEPCIRSLQRVIYKLSTKYTLGSTEIVYSKVSDLLAVYRHCKRLCVVGEAQSADVAEVRSNQTMQEQETPVYQDVDKKSTVEPATTFLDTYNIHAPPTVHNSVPRPNNSNVKIPSESWMERSVLVSTMTWASTNAIWTSIGKVDFPHAYFNNIIVDKLAGIKYCRPKFKITIEINATRMHYGRLVFAVIPFYRKGPLPADTAIANCYDSAYNVFTWPHWYQVSAGVNQTIAFEVPYRHIMNQIELDSNDVHSRYMFTVVGYVAAPLACASGTTASSVTVNMFAKMIESNLAGLVFTGAVVQSGEQEFLSNNMVCKQNVGGGETKVVSDTLTSATTITKDLANLAFHAGLSVPVNLATTSSMQIRQPLIGKAEDCPNSVVLGPSMAARVRSGPEFVNSESSDDMNINQFASRPGMWYTLKLENTSIPGTVVWSSPLKMSAFKFGATDKTDPKGAYYPLPVGLLGHQFHLWRGGFKVTFAAVASQFHSCRLRIFYIPGGMEKAITNPTTLQQSSHLKNVTWDISRASDITVRIPYESTSHWRYSDIGGSHVNSLSGQIGLQVVGALTSSAATGVVNPIYIQIFLSADDDFQVAQPAKMLLAKSAPDFATVVTQAGDLDDFEACTIASSSSTCLREQTGILLGDVDVRCRKWRDNHSFAYTSLKQLINHVLPISRFNTAATDTNLIRGFKYTVYGTGIESYKYDNELWICPLHYILPLFRFVRGSFRCVLISNDKRPVDVYVTSAEAATPIWSDNNFSILNGEDTEKDNLFNTGMGYVAHYDTSVFPVDFVVPYNNVNPCLITNGSTFSADSSNNYQYAQVSVSSQKNKGTYIFCVGAGDDFELGYPMAIPRIRTGAATVRATRSVQIPKVLPSTQLVDTDEELERLIA